MERTFEAAAVAVRTNPMNAPAVHSLRAFDAGLDIKHSEIAILTSKWWGNPGVALTVSFLDTDDSALQQRILGHMNAWQQFANVHFSLVASNGQVRISRIDDGYWSYLGTDLRLIPADEATMNLQAFSMDTPESEYHRVVRHETGHTLGFPHEHMRAEIVDRIDPAKAIAYFGAPPNNWPAEKVRDQVLTPLERSALNATNLADVNSIMCYSLPAEIMKDNIPVPGGLDIDALDGQFAALTYPKSAAPTTPLPT
jgi:hypothetical protein